MPSWSQLLTTCCILSSRATVSHIDLCAIWSGTTSPLPATQYTGSGSGNTIITGTNRPDTLIGTSGLNLMYRLETDDRINRCESGKWYSKRRCLKWCYFWWCWYRYSYGGSSGDEFVCSPDAEILLELKDELAENVLKEAQSRNWTTVSMKDDFRIIYPNTNSTN
jgi:hypothetical protein